MTLKYFAMAPKNSDLLAPYPDMNLNIVEELQVFLDLVDPGQFRNQLVQLYMEYAVSKREELPQDFTDMTQSLGFFIQFLNKVERERLH
ncbi:MAG: hypothetical protein Roseis2KO_26490 [Roseivirga sp.]